MKYPSRWGQPGEASSALHHSPAAKLPASCYPLTSCIYHLGKKHHQSLKKLYPSSPVIPTKVYFLGTTAHLGPFLGSKSEVICLCAEHS